MRPCRGVHSEPDRGSCCCRPRRSCREGQLQATCGLSPPPPRSPHTGCCQSASADRQPGRTCCAPPHAHPFSSPSGETKRGLLSRRETRDMWELAGEACGPGRSPGQPGPRGLLGRLGGAAWSGPWAHRQNGGGGGRLSQLLSVVLGPSQAQTSPGAFWVLEALGVVAPCHLLGCRTSGWVQGRAPWHREASRPVPRVTEDFWFISAVRAGGCPNIPHAPPALTVGVQRFPRRPLRPSARRHTRTHS